MTSAGNRCRRIVHMGDSITFGQYVDPRARWTTLVASHLAAEFGESSFESYNRGISGETSRMGLERFPRDVQDLGPDVLTLQFGLNDCNCWATDRGLPRVSERAFEANLCEMIDRARQFGTRSVILATNHPTLRRDKLPSGEVYEDANARYSDIIRAVALETEVILCDIRAHFGSYTPEQLEDLLLPDPDYLHLSPEGNAAYADAIWPQIELQFGLVLSQGDEQ